MKETVYAAERGYLERYLKEKALAPEGKKTMPEPMLAFNGGGQEAGIYCKEGSTARITIRGFLSPDGPDAWDRILGYEGTSYKAIREAMKEAEGDAGVGGVVLDIDSPGGTLAGCDETWQAHKSLAAKKPTVALAGSMMASAAYYIALPARRILASSPSSEIGSIGLLAEMTDRTVWEKNTGIRTVTIVSSNAPLKHLDAATEEGVNAVRERLDPLERIFYSRISECRGATAGHIAEHFGKGGLLAAQDPSPKHNDAIKAGMIDGLAAEAAGAAFNGMEAAAEAAAHKTTTNSEGEKTMAEKKDEKDGDEKDELEKLKERVEKLEGKAFKASEEDGGGEKEEDDEDEEEKSGKEKAASRAGAAKAEAAHAALAAKALPVLQSPAYPAAIKALACKVLEGKESMAALAAATAVFDSQREAWASQEAADLTEELGAVTPDAPAFMASAEKEIDAALQAEIKSRKEK